METGIGRPPFSPRIVLGTLIIKHTESLDDRGTIAIIQENPYMRYFPGLEEFDPNPVFDPSLFVELSIANGSRSIETPDFTRTAWKIKQQPELTLKGGGTTGIKDLKKTVTDEQM